MLRAGRAGFEYRERCKDFSGELGHYKRYNCAAGRTGRGLNPGMRIFLVPPNVLFNGSRYYVLGTMGLQRHDDNSCPYIGDVKNKWSYTPTPPIWLYVVDRVDNLDVG